MILNMWRVLRRTVEDGGGREILDAVGLLLQRLLRGARDEEVTAPVKVRGRKRKVNSVHCQLRADWSLKCIVQVVSGDRHTRSPSG